ncbi:MAG: substrate-binding domain-containing protein [Nocardiopsaceae bacterium]|jgi:ribose transport system substrate-binding protein|nr:substrate-binding domain-containing protein [Nocardiopsaceae bacterium]
MDLKQVARRDLLRATGGLGAGAGLATLLAACGQTASGASAKSSSTAMSKPKQGNGTYIAVSMLNSLPYFYDHHLGMTMAGKWLGVTTKFVGPSNLDLSGMISDLDSAISEGVSGLVVVGFDPSLAPSINKAIAAGIPTVTVDSDVPNSNRLCFLGTGNYEAGVLGAKQLIKLIGGSGKVALVTKTGQDNLNQRVAGYQDTLKKAGVDVVAVLNDNSDPTQAASVVTAAMRRTPDLKGVGCVEASGGSGAGTAVREAGKTGQIKIVSMDRDPETLNLIQKGIIQATVAQKTALMSFLGTVVCQAAQTIDIPITKDNKASGITELPASVDTGVEMVTTANAKYWQR